MLKASISMADDGLLLMIISARAKDWPSMNMQSPILPMVAISSSYLGPGSNSVEEMPGPKITRDMVTVWLTL